MSITRAEAEDFLYREAALLDEWRLDEWLALLTEYAHYRVPSNDAPGGDPSSTTFPARYEVDYVRISQIKR